ncbi:MAG: hypothetical protein LBG11_06625 [Bifidobacteriaceae bacterium]|jgi:hypothetical protein|nr:hypothetical protein [Bifidobacteriaceae bacterium]
MYSALVVVKTVPIRVPLATRDRIRRRAEAQGLTYGAVIEHSLNAADREGFWDRIAALRPDDAYRSESEH